MNKIFHNGAYLPVPENFQKIPNENLKKHSEILEKSQIQNILSWHGLEKRVLGLGYYNDQVCQLVEDGQTEDNQTKKKELAEKYSFCLNTRKFLKPYEDTVKQIYFEQGRYGKIYYQNVPELGMQGGPRQSLDRINYMKLDQVDFKNKTVLDVGCSGGFFCRYADNHGAASVLGLDMESITVAAKNMANILGNFSINYEVADLSKNYSTKEPFDVVFFLSMNYHIAVPDVVYQARSVVFEDNGKTTRHNTSLGKPWTDHFKSIEFVGRGLDHGDKSVYHLKK